MAGISKSGAEAGLVQQDDVIERGKKAQNPAWPGLKSEQGRRDKLYPGQAGSIRAAEQPGCLKNSQDRNACAFHENRRGRDTGKRLIRPGIL